MEKSRTNQPRFIRDNGIRPSMAYNFQSDRTATGTEFDEPEYIKNPEITFSEDEVLTETEVLVDPVASYTDTIQDFHKNMEFEKLMEYKHEQERQRQLQRQRQRQRQRKPLQQERSSQTDFSKQFPRLPEDFYGSRYNISTMEMGFDPDDPIWVERVLRLYETMKYIEESLPISLLPEECHRAEAFERDILEVLGPEWNLPDRKKDSVKAYINEMREFDPMNPVIIHAHSCNLYRHIFTSSEFIKHMRELVRQMNRREYKEAFYESDICFRKIFEFDKQIKRRVKELRPNYYHYIVLGMWALVLLCVIMFYILCKYNTIFS